MHKQNMCQQCLSSNFMLNINYFTEWYKLFYHSVKYILSSGKIKHEFSTNIKILGSENL